MICRNGKWETVAIWPCTDQSCTELGIFAHDGYRVIVKEGCEIGSKEVGVYEEGHIKS